MAFCGPQGPDDRPGDPPRRFGLDDGAKFWHPATIRTPISRFVALGPGPIDDGAWTLWRLRERSNLRIQLFRPALVHLSYTGEIWLRGWESNPTY